MRRLTYVEHVTYLLARIEALEMQVEGKENEILQLQDTLGDRDHWKAKAEALEQEKAIEDKQCQLANEYNQKKFTALILAGDELAAIVLFTTDPAKPRALAAWEKAKK